MTQKSLTTKNGKDGKGKRISSDIARHVLENTDSDYIGEIHVNGNTPFQYTQIGETLVIVYHDPNHTRAWQLDARQSYALINEAISYAKQYDGDPVEVVIETPYGDYSVSDDDDIESHDGVRIIAES